MEELTEQIENLINKVEKIERYIVALRASAEHMGDTNIHNFSLLEKKIDERMTVATKEIIAAIEKK